MFCEKCGSQVADGAKFCKNCGAPLQGGGPAVGPTPGYGSAQGYEPAQGYGPAQNGGQAAGSNAANQFFESLQRTMQGSDNSKKFRLIEGAISAVLAIMTLFIPVVSYGYGELSMFDLGRLGSYFGSSSPVIPIGILLMIAAVASSVIVCLMCFGVKIPYVDKIPVFAWVVAGYALIVIIVIAANSGRSYGIVRASIWVWFLLILGIGCGVLDILARKGNTNLV